MFFSRVIPILLLGSIAVPAQDEAVEEKAQDSERILSENFSTREAETIELLDWARSGEVEANREELLARYFESKEPEERFRIRGVLFEISREVIEQNGPGFLGIQMNGFRNLPRLPNGQLLQNNPEVVEVELVIPGSPAEEAGLQRGDVIIRIDEEDLQVPNAPDALSTYVSALRPGTEIEIEVIRGEEKLVRKAKLMNKRAIDPGDTLMLRPPSRIDGEKMESLLREDFDLWLNHQRKPEPPTPPRQPEIPLENR